MLAPSYGASHAGAVLRYDLAPNSSRNPAAYVRATFALDPAPGTARESETALGLSARPVAALPIAAHLELRAREIVGETELRPAIFAVTELQPINLTSDISGEAYAQAGYIGGKFATGFVDGQARVTGGVIPIGAATLRAGAGVWGGAQQGAARLDVGPSASADFRIKNVGARVQLDYRFRMAGDAEPANGVALTLSTGF